jgi:hypothetical protein
MNRSRKFTIGFIVVMLIIVGIAILPPLRDPLVTPNHKSSIRPTPSTSPTQEDKNSIPSDDTDEIVTFIEELSPTLSRSVSTSALLSSVQPGATDNRESSDGSSSPEPHTWTPVGRFVSDVFDSSDIDTQTISYGTITNYAGSNETLYMTVNTPGSAVDTETNRPLIVAITGGDTAGFCDSTLTTEQAAMLRLAQLGYVTVSLTPLLYPDFCDGASDSEYHANMEKTLEAADLAVQYLYNNANTYRIDVTRTAIYGYSIGGQSALLKLRDAYNDGPSVRLIAGFAAIAQDSPIYNVPFGPLATAGPTAPSVYMISFEPDMGYDPGINPDARADCSNLVVLGYDCTFYGLPFPAHAIHANSVSPDGSISAPAIFEPYLYETLVLAD